MSIDWNHFTPLSSLAGGALIGLAAAVLYLAAGRIAGISGILGQTVLGRRNGAEWRLIFLAGLLLAPWIASDAVLAQNPSAQSPSAHTFPLLIAAGLLTGYGTYLARGCTSGHGVCGLSRLSVRSLAAVVCFMGSGMATVAVLRHLIGAAT